MDGHHCNLYLPLADSAWPFLPVELPQHPPQDSSADMAAAAAEEELLRQALLRTTVEFESARMAAQEELRRMESHALHLTHLLRLATRERDDARRALSLLHGHRRQGDDPDDDDPRRQPPPPPCHGLDVEGTRGAVTASAAEVEAAAARMGLPERGRLVEAVMRAGPLLQTLMLAGPLPQWRHPPPELRCSDIPPVAISLNHWAVARDGADALVAAAAAAAGTAKPLSLPSTPSPPPPPSSVWNHSSSSSSPESGHSPNHQKLACFSVV